MFRRVLVANRGEIALRICRSLRELGIESVAVFSQRDRESPHVYAADRAVEIGPAAPAESYLSIERVLAAARSTQSDAVIPGYGFLAENAEFAQACLDAGLQFIGPTPNAIQAMGDKLQARRLMQAAGVPLVPDGPADDVQQALATSARLGFPVLLKASAGGGGKGMRRVDDAAALGPAFEAAQREALRAFGNGQLYVEKALTHARHVEVQVLGDQHGRLVHLFERDCSIQRRHQKVVEETPSPLLKPAVREQMTEVALRAARSVGYTSAGTVEFMLDENDQFYFLEMNTRLQVEHAITELVTGIDLVREMVRIAAGEPLSLAGDEPRTRGAAIECRLCAEDPSQGYLPRTGKITRWREPGGPFVRVDSGVVQGTTVGSDYDPLLAKICAWGPTREQAITRMQRALSELQVEGVTTNLNLLRRVIADPQFASGDYHTGYLATHPELATPEPSRKQLAALVAGAYLNNSEAASYQPATPSPWAKPRLR